jgi:hypothetical protein
MLYLAILLGMGVYVAALSLVYATVLENPATTWGRFGVRLKTAIVIKLGYLVPVGIVAYLGSFLGLLPLLHVGIALSDAYTGIFALSIVRGRSPSSILLITLIQGAFIVAELVLLSFVPLIRDWRRSHRTP